MKLAVLSESEADEAAIRILVEGLLATQTEPPSGAPIEWRGRGKDALLTRLPGLLKGLQFQTDAEALVVVLDSDRSPVHLEAHNQPGEADPKCRLCKIRTIVAQAKNELRARGCVALKTGLGLAVPAIEAWYLVGRDPHVGESGWIIGQQSGTPPYTTRSLKEKVYGTDRPSLEFETARAVEEVRRIVGEGNLPLVSRHFPGGFGALAHDIQNW